MVLAASLVMRHRAPRLAALLALTVIALALLQTGGESDGFGEPAMVLLIAGTVAAVAGSRPLAPGAALASAYRAAAPWWMVPSGRLAGTLVLVLPMVAIAVMTLGPRVGATESLSLGVVAFLFSATVVAGMLVVTPILGSSVGASVGFLAVWLGTAPPSVVDAALARWPVARGTAVLVWNVLPLNWRAVRWVREGTWSDLLHLAVWLAAGLAAAAWAVTAAYRSQRPAEGAVS
jgi:hypothetical protein